MNKLNSPTGNRYEKNISDLEKQISKYENLLDNLRDRIRDGIIELSPVTNNLQEVINFKIEYFNQAFNDYDPDTLPLLLGKNILQEGGIYKSDMWFQYLKETYVSNTPLEVKKYIPLWKKHLKISIFHNEKDGNLTCITKDITEEIENRKKYQELFHSSSDGIFLCSSDGHFIECNQTFEKLVGLYEKKIKNKPLKTILPGNWLTDKALEQQNILELNSKAFETELAHKNGTSIPISIRLSVTKDIDGKPIYIWGIVRDLTNQYKISSELSNKEKLIHELKDITNLGVFKHNFITDSHWWSDELYALLKLNKNSYTPTLKDFFKKIHPEDYQTVREGLELLKSSNKTIELNYRMVSVDNDIIYGNAKWIPTYNRKNVLESVEVIYYDTSDLINKEYQIDRFKKRQQYLSEHSFDGIFFYDQRGFIINSNKTSEKLLGYSIPELIGKHRLDFFIGLEKSVNQKRFENLLKSPGSSIQFEQNFRKKNGNLLTVLTVMTNLLKDPHINAVVSNFKDITEQRNAEATLIQNQAHLQSLLESADGFAIFRMKFHDIEDPESGEVIFVSPSIKELLFLENPMRIKDWLKDRPEDYRNQILKELKTQLKKLEKGNKTISKDNPRTGKTTHLQFVSKPLKDGDDYFLNGILIDITQQKETEFAIKLSEEKYRLLADNMNDVIFTFSEEHTLSYVSPSSSTMFSLGLNELKDKRYDELFCSKSVDKIKSTYRRRVHNINENNVDLEQEVLELKCKDLNKYIEVAIRNVYKPNGKFHFTLGIVRNITNQINAQKALKKRETLFNSILEQSPYSVVMTDKKGFIYYANKKGCSTFNYSLDQLLDMNMIELDHQFGHRKGREVDFFSKFPKDINVRYEAQIVNQKGKAIPVTYNIRVIEMNGEEFLLLYIEDISDKKHAEKAILQRDELFYSMLESSPFMVYLLNDKGQIGYANKNACNALGYNIDELLGAPLESFCSTESTDGLNDKLLESISTDSSITIEITQMGKNNNIIPVKADISKFYLDNFVYYLIFSQNIKYKKEAEKEIRIKNRAFESIHNAIIITDPNQNGNPIIYCNEAFSKITQYSKEDTIGQSIDFIFNQDIEQPEINVLKNVMEDLQSVELTLRSYKKNGDLFYNRFSISPVIDNRGKLLNHIGIIYDVTQQREIRQALRESEIKYRSLFEISADSLILIDTTTLNIIEVNEAACKTYGYNRYEFLKLLATDISANPILSKSVIESKKDGDKVSIQHQKHIRKSGEIFPCDIAASFSTIDDNLVVVISVKDISETINYIEKIKASERRYAQASLITKSGVWEMEPELNKIYYDENLERVFGYQSGEMNFDSSQWFDHIHIEDREMVKAYMDEIINNVTNTIEYEHRIIKKNGDEAWIYVKCTKLSTNGDTIRVLGTTLDITDKKRIQLKEKEQKNILESVLKSMDEGVILIDNKGKFELFNDSAKKILGIGPLDVDITLWPEKYGLYKPDTTTIISFTELPLIRALRGEFINEEELYIRNEYNQKGSFVLTSARQVVRPDGSIYGAVVIFRDITETKLYVDQLKTTEGRYLQAAKLGKLATFEIYPELDRFVYDDSLRNLLGYDYKNYKSSLKTWLTNVPEEDRDIILEVIQKYREKEDSESRIIHRIRRMDGAIRWVEVRSRFILSDEPNLSKIIGTIIDITEQKEAGDEIIKREELLNETGKLAKVGGWELNVSTNQLKWSNQTFRIYDSKSTERITLNKMISYCKPNYEDIFLEAIEEAIQNKDIVNVEGEIITQAGNEKWIKLIGKPIVVKDTVVRLVGAIQDITSQKITEEELILSKEKAEESDRLKSTFLTTMSHELRTPLNAVIGFSEIIDDTLPKDEIIQFARQINTSGNHLLNIIEDIFEISLIESGEAKVKRSEFELNSLLDDQFQLMLNEKQKLNKHEIDLKLIKTSPSEKLMVYTDGSRYKQILTNLIRNAIKFTHQGYVEFGYYLKENHLITVVKDTGIGISKDQHEIIFERFRQIEESNTRTYGGTGLGLYVCKKILEILDGEIWVESFPGKGSSFYFSIPINNYQKVNLTARNKRVQSIIDMTVFNNKEILIVEDEESNYLLLERILSKTPLGINWVKNGKDAIHYCTEEDVDLVLMDIQLPKLNGYEATKLIKNVKPSLPIIAQTAYAMSGDREKALEAGCDDYLSKPINRSELFRLLNKYLA